MKKVKGVAAAAAVMAYSPYDMYDDQRATFRYPTHMEDIEGLHKVLSVPSGNRVHEEEIADDERTKIDPVGRSQDMVIRSKLNMKAKKSTGKGTSSNRAMAFHLNQKGKTNGVKGPCFTHPALMLDVNRKQQKISSGKEEVTLRSSLSVLDLNQRDRLYCGKEATAQSIKPIFDLNQISREEEELEAQINSVRIEEFKRSSTRIGSDEQHHDVKISACRNTGNGPNRAGKRKISWQDQVALRA
ncbi:hypothetical protein CXB51_013015 [Gossypium anomalum]|uniref:Uncharacterized protein n=1 Tax=Gossypium anomalum TaxID=47600 RepID=A0A8J5YXJ6_9ROSI|nr:hypothetical protein CXB51_013015 [Gossypium anomalum]